MLNQWRMTMARTKMATHDDLCFYVHSYLRVRTDAKEWTMNSEDGGDEIIEIENNVGYTTDDLTRDMELLRIQGLIEVVGITPEGEALWGITPKGSAVFNDGGGKP